MRARPLRRATLAALAPNVLALVAVGCGGGTTTSAPTTTAPRTTTTSAAPCPSASVLRVTRFEETVEHEIATAFAQVSGDGGVGTLVLTLSDARLDEAAARSEDDPTLAKGQLLLRIRASNAAGELEAGSYHSYTLTTGDGKLIETAALFDEAGRVFPTEDHHLELTEITPERVCGRIRPDDDDALQYASEFTATRIAP